MPLYINVGNHETFPVNFFPEKYDLEKFNFTWMYSSLADSYEHWLPQQEVQKSLREGGYYTVSKVLIIFRILFK